MIHHRGAGSYLEESTSRVDTHHQQSFSTSKHLQVRDRGLSNFDVLIRIVDQPTGYTSAASAAAESASAREEVSSVFTEEEKLAIREVILQDVSIQVCNTVIKIVDLSNCLRASSDIDNNPKTNSIVSSGGAQEYLRPPKLPRPQGRPANQRGGTAAKVGGPHPNPRRARGRPERGQTELAHCHLSRPQCRRLPNQKVGTDL